jgi:hypothetical protein
MQVDEIAWSGLFLNAAMKAQTKTSILSAFGWGFSHVKETQAYLRSAEETE